MGRSPSDAVQTSCASLPSNFGPSKVKGVIEGGTGKSELKSGSENR